MKDSNHDYHSIASRRRLAALEGHSRLRIEVRLRAQMGDVQRLHFERPPSTGEIIAAARRAGIAGPIHVQSILTEVAPRPLLLLPSDRFVDRRLLDAASDDRAVFPGGDDPRVVPRRVVRRDPDARNA